MAAVPTVDCLIVSYNTRDLTRQTIRTLLEHCAADSVELSISVFDNASSDGSAAALATNFPDVRLHRSSTNLGFGAANNALARASRADYVLLLNSDVIVTEDLITPLRAALDADPALIAVGPRLLSPDGAPQYSGSRFPTLRYEFALALRDKRVARTVRRLFDVEAIIAAYQEICATLEGLDRPSDFVWATCWLLRRSDVADGIFDPAFPMYDEDLDFCRASARRGRTVRYLGHVQLTHIGGASTPSDVARHRLVRRSRRLYYARYHGRLYAWVYAFLVPVAGVLAGAVERIPRLGGRADGSLR